MAAMMAWNLSVTDARANEAEGSGSSYAMLCDDPETSPQTTGWGLFAIPQPGGAGTRYVKIALTAYPSKLKDPAGTKPYLSCSFVGNIDCDIATNNGVYLATTQYIVAYDIACDPGNGAIGGAYTQTPVPPMTQSAHLTIGATDVNVWLEPKNPFPGGTGGTALICYTAAVLKIGWSHSGGSGLISYPPDYPFNINTVFVSQEV